MRCLAYLRQWQIVRWSSIAIAVTFILILLVNGSNESAFRIAIRFTARSSCILFLMAFSASSLRRLRLTPFSNWLASNRRYLGLSMAISHGFHAVAIAGVAILSSENMVRDNHGANLGYLFILLMTITSFQRPAAILGRRNWKILHRVGMYYLWLSFTTAFSERLNDSLIMYVPFVTALFLAIILRWLPNKKKLQNT